MKKWLFLSVIVTIVSFWGLLGSHNPAQAQEEFRPEPRSVDTPATSSSIVISQFYGGGGNGATSQYSFDYVELFNRGNSPVNLNGWSTQYANTTGTNWLVTPLSNFTLQPGQYYLIQYAGGTTTTNPLPTPDLIAPVAPGQTFVPNLSGSTGKLALVNSTTQLPAQTCPSDATIIDLVGYGSTANCFEGAHTADLSNTTAAIRNTAGCTDTDNNSTDFTITVPAPRNSSTTLNPCGAAGLQANGLASPNSAAPGDITLLTVTVTPAVSPPSTGITVMADLSSIGGSSTQQLFDDGSNGDTTAGDNVFSFLAAIPGTATGGIHVFPVSVADTEGNTASTNITFTVAAPADPAENLAMGNPTGATTDVAFPDNYLLIKSQYVMSYNRDRGAPNWVAWHLDTTWLGGTDRQNDFRPDPSLPAGWYEVQANDFSGTGFDRGHHCPSADRTDTVADNSATFFMSNMMAQAPNNNQGPWASLEDYCRTLANSGNELYIYDGSVGMGGSGSNGGTTNTVANGHVVVPSQTWKVIIVLPVGDNDVNRVYKTTRTIAVIMPNAQSIGLSTPWRNFRVSVRQVEQLTGYSFFTNVRPLVRGFLKLRVDTL